MKYKTFDILKCPNCLEQVHDAEIYNRDTKFFHPEDTWQFCQNCGGIILKKDAIKGKLKGHYVNFKNVSGKKLKFWVRD